MDKTSPISFSLKPPSPPLESPPHSSRPTAFPILLLKPHPHTCKRSHLLIQSQVWSQTTKVSNPIHKLLGEIRPPYKSPYQSSGLPCPPHSLRCLEDQAFLFDERLLKRDSSCHETFNGNKDNLPPTGAGGCTCMDGRAFATSSCISCDIWRRLFFLLIWYRHLSLCSVWNIKYLFYLFSFFELHYRLKLLYRNIYNINLFLMCFRPLGKTP